MRALRRAEENQRLRHDVYVPLLLALANGCVLVCAASGVTPSAGKHMAEKTDGKTCEKCTKKKGVREFRQVQNIRSDICRSCEEVICSTCHTHRNAREVNEKIVDVYFRRRLYVCESCSLAGCTLRDTCLYLCSSTGCGRAFGHAKFDALQIKNHKTRGTKLHCHMCKEEEARQAEGARRCEGQSITTTSSSSAGASTVRAVASRRMLRSVRCTRVNMASSRIQDAT